jgi:hypothetical protein
MEASRIVLSSSDFNADQLNGYDNKERFFGSFSNSFKFALFAQDGFNCSFEL